MTHYIAYDHEKNIVSHIEAPDQNAALSKLIEEGHTPADDYLLKESPEVIIGNGIQLYKQVEKLIGEIINRRIAIQKSNEFKAEQQGLVRAKIDQDLVENKWDAGYIASLKSDLELSLWATDYAIERWQNENKAALSELFTLTIHSYLVHEKFEIELLDGSKVSVDCQESNIYAGEHALKCPFEF